MTSRNGISAQRDASYHCCRAFLSLFARSRPPPKTRDQKPRFFLGGSLSACGGGGAFAVSLTTAAGGGIGSICTGTGLSVAANTVETAPVNPPMGCSLHSAVGSGPRAKYSVHTIERPVTSPRSSRTTAWWHPSAASFPDNRQTVAVTMPGGVEKPTGLSPLVATFMKLAQTGTATSAANPFGRIVCGWSKPTQTPAT